jgi:hypothetical protein
LCFFFPFQLNHTTIQSNYCKQLIWRRITLLNHEKDNSYGKESHYWTMKNTCLEFWYLNNEHPQYQNENESTYQIMFSLFKTELLDLWFRDYLTTCRCQGGSENYSITVTEKWHDPF